MMIAQSDVLNELEVHDHSGFGAGLASRECRNRGGTEPNKRLNKLRSIRLSKVRSFRQSRRSANSRSDGVSSIFSGHRATLSPIPMSDASPNYMKATSCSSARKENYFQASPRNSESSTIGPVDSSLGSPNNLKPKSDAFLGQKPARALARRSSFKPAKGLTRMSSLRSKRPPMKKYSGGGEMKRKLKKSRSIKFEGFDSPRAKNPYNRPPVAPGNSFDRSKEHFQVSPRNSGSGFSSNGYRKNWIILNTNLGSGQKSLMRKSSIRPVRILTKMSSLKPRRTKHDGATCFSTLKNSKFPHHIELHPVGSESERTSVMKVCPYKYCSLNGHCHAPLPPLKPFLLRRRRLLKKQKTMRKRFSDLEKEIQAYKMVFHIGSGGANSLPAEKAASEEFFVEIYDKPRSDFQAANCSIGKGSDGLVSEVIGRDFKGEEIVVSNLDSGSSDSNSVDDQPDSVVSCSMEGGELGLCNKPSPTLDDSESTSHEEVALSGEFVSILNSEFSGGGSETNGEKADDSTIATAESSCTSEPDRGSLQGCSRDGDSKLPCNTNKARESQLENQKFIRMWRLIYHHAVSGTASKVGAQENFDGTEGEKQLDDTDSLVNDDACQDFSETRRDNEDNDADCQKIELSQIDAIRLVEEAIDGILLPEGEDSSSDDHLVTSGSVLDQELSETSHREDKESSIPERDGFRDPEQTLLRDDNAAVQVNERTIFKRGDKLVKETRNSWSNLKRVILLNKFIKAVEKVKKFNPREPRYLPLEPKSELEKIYLRRQEMYGRKKAEEWMLDYALQQVVSRLTPTRRRKVALLVKAFEAISPLQDIESPLKPTPEDPLHAKPVRASSSPSLQCREETGKEMRSRECAEQINDSLTVEEKTPVASSDLQDTKVDCFRPGTELEKSLSVAAGCNEKREENVVSSLDNGEHSSTLNACQTESEGSCLPVMKDSGLHPKLSSKTEDNGSSSTCCEEVQVDGETHQEAHQEIISCLKFDPEEDGRNVEIGMENSPIRDDSQGWAATTGDSLEVQHVANGRLDPDLEGNPSSGGSEPESNGAATFRIQMDRQRSNRMWYLIYQHMVSDIGETVEIRPLPRSTSETDPNKGREDHGGCSEDTELRQSDAIKLVQEALEQMLSSQSQQDPSLDDPPSTNTVVITAESRDVDHMKTENAEEAQIKAENHLKTPSKTGSKKWSHLKKVILLTRFVKSLEKVKKFNPRGPRFLAPEPDPEAEKVSLRHQTTEDRKNSEEWMLDYALQQAVTKLSPARRRRVELLVEAFETVTPLTQNNLQRRRTAPSNAQYFPASPFCA